MTPPRTRWPLLVIGAAAGTSTWSGWVGLGELTGFGVIHPLPGIADQVALNTAITLPIGVEAYAVYALAVATGSQALTVRARRYAWASAAAALALGMFGQGAYHLMTARGVTTAPWQVVVAVSCLPVMVLGAASLLWHLAGEQVAEAVETPTRAASTATIEPSTPTAVAEPVPNSKFEPRDLESPPAPEAAPAKPARQAARTATDVELADAIGAVLAVDKSAGRGKVTAYLKARGLTPGNSERLAAMLAEAKRPRLVVNS